jgi:hypothetical protein
LVTIFKKPVGEEKIDVSSAYNIWNTLKVRYSSVETMQLLKSFIHDSDFLLVIKNFLDDYYREISTLEKVSAYFKLTLPDRPPLEIFIEKEINQINDKLIYKMIHNDLMGQLFSLTQTLRSTTTNDRLREIFRKAQVSRMQSTCILGQL